MCERDKEQAVLARLVIGIARKDMAEQISPFRENKQELLVLRVYFFVNTSHY